MTERLRRLPQFVLVALVTLAVLVLAAVTTAQPQSASECCPCAAEVTYAADLAALRGHDGLSYLDMIGAGASVAEVADLVSNPETGRTAQFGTDRRNASIWAVARAWRCLRAAAQPPSGPQP